MQNTKKFYEYTITSDGRIFNKKGKEIKGTLDRDGYRRVRLNTPTEKDWRVGRLIATVFIPNPENKPTVDHINRNRTDDRVENLRWATYKEQSDNSDFMVGITAAAKTRSKMVICIETGEIFESAKDASKHYNLSRCSVSNACTGNKGQVMAGKLHWKYLEG